jgi:DNA-binding NarL/FixJ family response regulator
VADKKQALLVSSSKTISSLLKTFITDEHECLFNSVQTEGMLCKQLSVEKPDFLLLESNFWGYATPFFLTELMWKFKQLKIAVFNFEYTPAAFAARFLVSGADSFVDIRAADGEIRSAFHIILNGGSFVPRDVATAHQHIDILPPSRKLLTPKEMKILLLFAKGYSCRAISSLLNRTEQSIRNAKTVIYRKCGVKTGHELIVYALATKLLNVSELWTSQTACSL